MIFYGFKISIDFTGGSVIEYRLNKEIPTSVIQTAFHQKNSEIESIQKNKTQYLIKTTPIEQSTENAIKLDIEKKENVKIDTLRFETVGPTIGRETMVKTVLASFFAIMGILLYMTFAFKNLRFGMAAIVAMLHDFLIMVGSFSIMSHFLGAEVDSLFITALLTSLTFSVHDTIVVFDKIREYRKNDRGTDIEELANRALTETMVRSFNNSLTIMLMLIALLLVGGETIKFFTAALLIGTITGSYSSPFIATPVLVWLEKRKK
jgi:preprotein translocase subunit SecF